MVHSHWGNLTQHYPMLLLSILSNNALNSSSISFLLCFNYTWTLLAASSSLKDLVSSKLLFASLGVLSSNSSAFSYWSRRLSLKLLFLGESPPWNWWMLINELLRNLILWSTLQSKSFFLISSESFPAAPPLLSSSSNIWKCSETLLYFLVSVYVAKSSLFCSFF